MTLIKRFATFFKYQFLTIAWGIFIFILCSRDRNALEGIEIPAFDKFAHAGAFAVLTFFLVGGAVKQFGITLSVWKRAAWIAVNLGLLYGILIEFYQGSYTLGRQADIYDAFADLAGCLLGIFGTWILIRKKLRKT